MSLGLWRKTLDEEKSEVDGMRKEVVWVAFLREVQTKIPRTRSEQSYAMQQAPRQRGGSHAVSNQLIPWRTDADV